jgi:hypothetical protein
MMEGISKGVRITQNSKNEYPISNTEYPMMKVI